MIAQGTSVWSRQLRGAGEISGRGELVATNVEDGDIPGMVV